MPQPGHRERGWPGGPALPQRGADQLLQFEFAAAPPAFPHMGPDPGLHGRVEFPVQVGSDTGAQQQVTHGMHASGNPSRTPVDSAVTTTMTGGITGGGWRVAVGVSGTPSGKQYSAFDEHVVP